MTLTTTFHSTLHLIQKLIVYILGIFKESYNNSVGFFLQSVFASDTKTDCIFSRKIQRTMKYTVGFFEKICNLLSFTTRCRSNTEYKMEKLLRKKCQFIDQARYYLLHISEPVIKSNSNQITKI